MKKNRQLVTHVGVADGRVRYSSDDLDNQIRRFKYDPNQKWFTLPERQFTRLEACEMLIAGHEISGTNLTKDDIDVVNKALAYHYIRLKTTLNKERKNGKTQATTE